MKHLFQNLNIKRFTSEDIKNIFEEDINKSDVNLTFKWTPSRQIIFYKLHLNVSGQTIDLLNGSSVNTEIGTNTFNIGTYDDSVDLEINYGILALVAVPRIISLLSQTNPTAAYQVSPKDPGKTNKIESGDKFEESIKYKVQ